MIYLELFWVFFQIGILCIGGGYVAIPMIQSQVVTSKGWLSPKQFSDLLALDELTPGPIAINSATFVGMRIAGISGALIATAGFIFPSIFIVSLLAFLYNKYKNFKIIQNIMKILRPVIAAAIISTAITLVTLCFWGDKGFTGKFNDFNIISGFIFILSLYILRKYKANPLFVILGTGGVGAIAFFIL